MIVTLFAVTLLGEAQRQKSQDGPSSDDAVGNWLRRFQDSQSGQTR